MFSTRARAAVIGVLFLCMASAAEAQWGIAAGIRAPRFSGGAAESGTGRSLMPYRPTMWEITLERMGARAGVGLRLNYASSSLALEGPDALAAVKDALEVYGIDPEVSLRLRRLGVGGLLRIYAGPLLEVWRLPDTPSEWRLGFAASLALEVPFGERWAGTTRVGAAVLPTSPFTESNLDPSFEPEALWRREVSASLRYRW